MSVFWYWEWRRVVIELRRWISGWIVRSAWNFLGGGRVLWEENGRCEVVTLMLENVQGLGWALFFDVACKDRANGRGPLDIKKVDYVARAKCSYHLRSFIISILAIAASSQAIIVQERSIVSTLLKPEYWYQWTARLCLMRWAQAKGKYEWL